MTAPNPLVAPRVDSTTSYSGIFVAEDIATLIEGFKTNDWVDITLGTVTTTLDTVALVADPVGQVIAMGAAYLIDHVKPLSDALEVLTGDPDQVAAYAHTWRNAADAVDQAGTALQAAVDRETASWTGAVGDAYRNHISEQLAGLAALKNACTAMSEIVHGAGVVVAFTRGLVRDLVAQAISTLAARLPVWAAEAGVTLGIATPAIVVQATTVLAAWTARVAEVMRGIVKTLQRLLPILRHLEELIKSLSQLLKRLARRAPHGPGEHEPHLGGGHEDPFSGGGDIPGSVPPLEPDEIDRIIEGIIEEPTPQPGDPVSGGSGNRGHAGEQGMGFYYSQEKGWAFLEGPSGGGGHASNARGFDGVAFRTDGPPEIQILDNKSLARDGNVSSASAITTNLKKNLDALAQRAADPALNDVPRIQEVRDSIAKAREALATGRPLPPDVHLVVTNSGGASTGVTAGLAGQGVEFRNLN
jgi:hypothetical protein